MSLPLDLLYAITEQLGHHIPTLKALSLTCKELSDYCQRRIFSTITANIVVGELGTWKRGTFGKINLDALLVVIKDNRHLGSYVKHLFLSLECNRRFYYSMQPQEEWFNHHLPQFCQSYIRPLLVNLTKLEILRLHSDLSLIEDADLNQTIGIFQAISSPFLSHISICNLALALPAAVTAHLSNLELLSSPFRVLQNAEHRPTPIKLESFGYLIEDCFNSTIFAGSSHTLRAIKDSKTLDFTGLRSFQFGSRHDQDHYGAAQILAAAAAQLEELIYVFPPDVSGGEVHVSIPTSLLHPDRRTLFEHAKALRNVTFRISAGDVNEDLGYSGIDFPRIFTWTIQSLTVLSGCPRLEEIRFQILHASGPLFASLSDDWRRLDALLVSGTDIPASLKRVSICIEITRYMTSDGEKSRLRKEWGDLARELFKETHEKTDIVVSLFS